MTLVVDASFVVAALIDTNPVGTWADRLLATAPLAAPHLMVVESANILRRQVLKGAVSVDAAALAHADLLELRVSLYPYAPFAERVWSLRDTVSAYDALYVALAESLGASLATLDLAMARAPGPECTFTTFPG